MTADKAHSQLTLCGYCNTLSVPVGQLAEQESIGGWETDQAVCRASGKAEKAIMMMTITVCGEDGAEMEVRLPAHFVVCPRCEGAGTHVNPSIDGNGISAEEFAEDPDFAESYFSGAYDVPCSRCGGKRVVEEVDEDQFTPAQKAAYAQYEESQSEIAREYASERHLREGCG